LLGSPKKAILLFWGTVIAKLKQGQAFKRYSNVLDLQKLNKV
jgi:hypothetical protein